MYETQYLHMVRFARGIRNGARVQQGQVIGYVGSWDSLPALTCVTASETWRTSRSAERKTKCNKTNLYARIAKFPLNIKSQNLS